MNYPPFPTFNDGWDIFLSASLGGSPPLGQLRGEMPHEDANSLVDLIGFARGVVTFDVHGGVAPRRLNGVEVRGDVLQRRFPFPLSFGCWLMGKDVPVDLVKVAPPTFFCGDPEELG